MVAAPQEAADRLKFLPLLRTTLAQIDGTLKQKSSKKAQKQKPKEEHLYDFGMSFYEVGICRERLLRTLARQRILVHGLQWMERVSGQLGEWGLKFDRPERKPRARLCSFSPIAGGTDGRILTPQELFDRSPEIRDQLFHKKPPELLATKLGEILAEVVRLLAIETPKELSEQITEMALRHIAYGVMDEHVDPFKDALIACMKRSVKQKGFKWSQRAKRAWEWSLTEITDLLMDAVNKGRPRVQNLQRYGQDGPPGVRTRAQGRPDANQAESGICTAPVGEFAFLWHSSQRGGLVATGPGSFSASACTWRTSNRSTPSPVSWAPASLGCRASLVPCSP